MAENFIEKMLQGLTDIYNWVLSWFDFDLFGKNIKSELDSIFVSLIFFLLIIICFKSAFSKSDSNIGKIIIVFLFVLIYLILQIWFF